MYFYRNLIVILSLMFLYGCSAAFGSSSKELYKEGYRQGVKEQVQQVVGQFQGGDFPYYHWSSPLVQETRIPAHISNGVMIPEHDELVIIKPGEWAMDQSYPIQYQQRKSYDNQIVNSNLGVADITAMPSVGHSE